MGGVSLLLGEGERGRGEDEMGLIYADEDGMRLESRKVDGGEGELPHDGIASK